MLTPMLHDAQHEFQMAPHVQLHVTGIYAMFGSLSGW